MKNNFKNIFYLPPSYNLSSFTYTSSKPLTNYKFEKEFSGFVVTILDILNSKAIFLYVNNNQIEQWELYEGPSIHKESNNFIYNIVKSISDPENLKSILIPKAFINKNVINSAFINYNVKLIKYSVYTDCPPIISNFRTIYRLNYDKNKDLKTNVDIINNELNSIKINFNSQIKKQFNPSNIKRKYSSTSKANIWEIKKSRLTGYSFLHYHLNNIPLSNNIINNLYHLFWSEIVTPSFNENNKLKLIRLQFRVRFEDGSDRSINNLNWFKINELQKALDNALEFWNDKNEVYKQTPAISVFIMYKFFNREFERIATPIEYKDTPRQLYSGFNLPITMDLEKWGEIEYLNENRVLIKLFNSSYKAEVFISHKSNIVDLYRLDKRLLCFEDIKINEYTFKRVFKEKTFYYDNGKQVLVIENIKCEFIKKLKPVDTFISEKIITMDIETKETIIDHGRIMTPICLSVYDGKNILNFGLWDYNNYDEMIVAAFNSIFKRKYDGYNIYFHNLANFDAVFILRPLSNIKGINFKPIIKDGRIIKIDIQYSPSYKITLMDSYQIMPSSLDKLAKTFKVENKMLFPHKFVNEHPLDYKGSFPGLKYFFHPDSSVNPMAFEDFLNRYTALLTSYIHQDWILKDELIKYCNNDVIILHKIIKIFTEELYNRYKINPFKYPTLASLAFAIYRTKYMTDENIPILTGRVYDDIKKAYYGGMVEVYKPYAENLKKYDVNSLYPDSMKKRAMPVGNPIYFEGDLSYLENAKSMGFVYASINMPHLHKPLLPKKHNVRGSVQSTIYPVGDWKGWYTIFELENSRNLVGSQYKIEKGYLFDQEFIFDEYVTDLFKIKSNVSPNDPWYLISKLLLNSLYGRFGLNPDLEEHMIIDPEEYDRMLLNSKNIIDHQEIGEKILVTVSNEKKEEANINTSIAVSAAIASWSRVHMTYYIVKYGDNIVYIDTDGIILTTCLDPEEIGKELGKMKFEGEYEEGVFLAPKLYSLVGKNEMIVKIKGFKNTISHWENKTLLYEEKLEKSQEKWHRDFVSGNIKIKDEVYTISATENKRSMIRDSRGRLVVTKPFIINE